MSTTSTPTAVTVLAASLSSAATTLLVQAGTGTMFPAPVGAAPVRLVVRTLVNGTETAREVMTCSGRSGDVLAGLVRAQEGTAAGTFAAGAVVEFGDSSGLTDAALPAPAMTTLTDVATITWTVSGVRDPRAKVTLGGNRTLAFSGLAAGQSGVLLVTQDGAGSRTLTLPAGSIVRDTGAGAVTLSTGAGKKDLLSFVYDGANLWWSYGVSYT